MPQLLDLDGRRKYAVGPHTVIGRAAGCDVRLEDPMVSLKHAEIRATGGGTYEICDLDSRRGIFVGNRKVKTSPLVDGDELLIGPMRFRFELADGASTATDPEELIRLRAVVALSRAIGVEHDLTRLCDRVIETCFEILSADRAAIVIFEHSSKAPFLTVSRDRSKRAPFAVSTSLLGQVMVSHEAYLRTEVDSDLVLQRAESLSTNGVRSVMAVPLRYEAGETEWLGVILADSIASSRMFSPRDLELLDAIAGPAALAIKNAMLVRHIATVVDDEAQRRERVVRDLPLGVVVLDDRLTCTLVNRWVTSHPALAGVRIGTTVEALAGISCDSLVGSDVHTHVTHDDRVLAIAATTSGRETVVVIHDVTVERERINREAHRDRVAMIGQLAGGIAHDFNNLLHVILSYSGILEESLPAGSPERDDVAQISHAATSAADLTRQLLTFSRRELVAAKVVEIETVVLAMEKLLRRTLGSGIELVTKIGKALPRVLIDASQLEQILMNLVVNARDAMAGRGRVTLALDLVEVDAATATSRSISQGAYASIEVTDTGSGMAPDVASRVFEPYFTTKARGKGTGLGLATVHGIVQLAHGDIAVRSTVGVGTTIKVLLPATELSVEGSRPIPTVGTAAALVLVVDDDDDVRRVTERILRNAGYTVLSASSSSHAMQVAREHSGMIDLLLTDIVMPGQSGRELARELQQLRPSLRVMFMSGYHPQTPIGNSQFIAKPFSRTDLLHKLTDALARDPSSEN